MLHFRSENIFRHFILLLLKKPLVCELAFLSAYRNVNLFLPQVMHFFFCLLTVNLKTSRHEYVMKAAKFRKACELPPDFNIKLYASQAHSDIRFIHILITRNISLTFCILCNILLIKTHMSLFVDFFMYCFSLNTV